MDWATPVERCGPDEAARDDAFSRMQAELMTRCPRALSEATGLSLLTVKRAMRTYWRCMHPKTLTLLQCAVDDGTGTFESDAENLEIALMVFGNEMLSDKIICTTELTAAADRIGWDLPSTRRLKTMMEALGYVNYSWTSFVLDGKRHSFYFKSGAYGKSIPPWNDVKQAAKSFYQKQ